MVVVLCSAPLLTLPAVFLHHHQELIGTFLMEVATQILYHTTEVGMSVLSFVYLYTIQNHTVWSIETLNGFVSIAAELTHISAIILK